MKPAIFEEIENQLIDALISHDLHGVSTADMHHPDCPLVESSVRKGHLCTTQKQW